MAELTTKQKKIANYLANGLRPAQVASMVGVTPGYISQICKPGVAENEAFLEHLEEEKRLALESYNQEEAVGLQYQALEARTLRVIEENLAAGTLTEQIKILEALNKRDALRRQAVASVAGTSAIANINVVQISMPKHLLEQQLPEVVMNEQRQVISVQGKSMAPMPSDMVKAMFQKVLRTEEGQEKPLAVLTQTGKSPILEPSKNKKPGGASASSVEEPSTMTIEDF